jgi:hypothetical protein
MIELLRAAREMRRCMRLWGEDRVAGSVRYSAVYRHAEGAWGTETAVYLALIARTTV